MSKTLVSLSGLFLFLAAATGFAKADTLYYLNQGSCCTLPGSGYYGTVDLVQDGLNVDLTVQLNDAEFIQTSGGNSHQTFAFNDPSITSTSQIQNVVFTPSASDSLSGTPPTATVFQSGFGYFTIAIDCTSCGTGGSGSASDPTKLTFTVDNVLVSSFTGNTGQKSTDTTFTADIYDNLDGQTGIVGDDGVPHQTTPVVPEPSTMLLLGTGLATLAGTLKLKLFAI